jgi:hypothetical protein
MAASTPSGAGVAPRRVLAVALIGLMAVGSVVLWIGCPFFWLWLASHLQKSSQPTMGPYLLIIVGIPGSMVLVGKLLSRLNGYYGRVTGRATHVRVRLPWHRSLRGERDSGRPRTVLDVVMVISVAIAGTAFLIWFFAFAGSSLPS